MPDKAQTYALMADETADPAERKNTGFNGPVNGLFIISAAGDDDDFGSRIHFISSGLPARHGKCRR